MLLLGFDSIISVLLAVVQYLFQKFPDYQAQ